MNDGFITNNVNPFIPNFLWQKRTNKFCI